MSFYSVEPRFPERKGGKRKAERFIIRFKTMSVANSIYFQKSNNCKKKYIVLFILKNLFNNNNDNNKGQNQRLSSCIKRDDQLLISQRLAVYDNSAII